MTNEINVITTVSSWPEALELQRKSLHKFSENPFKFIAVIDTSETPNAWNLWDASLRKRAIEIANEYCDEVVVFPEELHANRRELFPKTKTKRARYSNERAADVLQFVFRHKILESQKSTMIIDSDMFPIANFNLVEQLQINKFRGVLQHRKGILNKKVKYFWNGIIQLSPSELPELVNFSLDCGKVKGARVDTGGQSHYWIEKLEKVYDRNLLGEINHLSSLNWQIPDLNVTLSSELFDFIVNDDRNVEKQIFTEIYDDKFLHFRAGSNWREEDSNSVKKRHHIFLDALATNL